MSTYILTLSVFLYLVIISRLLCQATPILTPHQHTELEGDEFCDRSSETLKAICVQAAKNEKIKGYDTKPLKNLPCKKGNNAKVLLDPGNGEAWELVQDALLECIFKMPADQFIPQPYTVDRIFGRGRNKYDAFRYEWSQEKSNYVATGLYKNLLKGLV